MSNHQQNMFASDFERSTAASSHGNDGVRFRPAGSQDDNVHADPRIRQNASADAGVPQNFRRISRDHAISSESYSPTRQGKQIATMLVIGVALLAGAMIYALRSSGVSGMFHKMDTSVTSAENPSAITDRMGDSIVPDEVTLTAPVQDPTAANTTDGQRNNQVAAVPQAQSTAGRIEELTPVPAPKPTSSVNDAVAATTPKPVDSKPVITKPVASPDDVAQIDPKAKAKVPATAPKKTTDRPVGDVSAANTDANKSSAQVGNNSNGTQVPLQVHAIAKAPSSTIATAPRSATAKPAEANRTEAKPSTTTAVAGKTATYSVQVGATPDKKEADKLVSQLKAKRIANVSVEKSMKDNKPVYRVRFGSFTTRDAAKAAAGRTGNASAWIISKPVSAKASVSSTNASVKAAPVKKEAAKVSVQKR